MQYLECFGAGCTQSSILFMGIRGKILFPISQLSNSLWSRRAWFFQLQPPLFQKDSTYESVCCAAAGLLKCFSTISLGPPFPLRSLGVLSQRANIVLSSTQVLKFYFLSGLHPPYAFHNWSILQRNKIKNSANTI